ncbi:transglutaminase TgpA family protein [Pseudomaricurvus sp.]|uniref:transglutaminase TgpA family protein n=1 Tax=Pseudomaricurvus sp. TaxID=2004510 RepID=UPI003F6C3D16
MSATGRQLLPRNSLLWLISAQGLAIAPMLLELPYWLIGLWGLVLIWRLQEFRGRWAMPGKLIKTAMVAVCVSGLFLSFGRLLGLEPMVTMLICALLLKQLEMQRRQDALLLVYLTFFLIGVQFLFSQTLLASVYGAVCVWIALCSLLSMHQPSGHERPWRSLRLAGRLSLHTVPLMILLFLVMPRFGSLWSVPNPTQSAKTGVSDSMSPGDFSRLSRSGGVAFRVTFDGERPPQHLLYWRGLVFSEFDGRRWTQRKGREWDYRDGSLVDWYSDAPSDWRIQSGSGNSELSKPVTYSIIMEASHQRWLYGLMAPVAFEQDPLYGLTRNFTLLRRQPVHQRLQYEVTSQLEYQASTEPLTSRQRARELALPDGFNPETLQKANAWRQQAGSEQAYLSKVLAFYRDNFDYTLEPPALGRDTVDEFLWQTQRGFCEHFASSFVVLMRAAGIPARVVAGYQGGEYNSADDYLVVHQYDAHAWTEVWLEGQGWTRVDPTAAVAADRVERSLGDLQSDMVEGALSLGRYRQFKWVAELRMEWDALNYRWHKAVINFDSKAQSELLSNLLGGVSPLRLVLFVLLVGGGLLLLISLHLWWRARPAPKPPALHQCERFERLLRRKGWVRLDREPVGEFAARVSASVSPKHSGIAEAVSDFADLFQREQYAGEVVSSAQWRHSLKSLQRVLREL